MLNWAIVASLGSIPMEASVNHKLSQLNVTADSVHQWGCCYLAEGKQAFKKTVLGARLCDQAE